MELDGYLNVLKAPGWTSHDVVARLRRLTRMRRIGHTGTLDPAAIGVLPIALGRATRSVSSSTWDRKEYLADVHFGFATDTDDAEGQPLRYGDSDSLGLEALRPALGRFVGEIAQHPPAYSAVHVNGLRSYRRARLGEQELPPARAVQIDEIVVVAWRSPILSLRVQCHSGTYIRSLARDLGDTVGCPAHLGALVRSRVGPFALDSALDLVALERVAEDETWDQVVVEPDVAGLFQDAILAGDSRAADLQHGRSWAMAYDRRESDPTEEASHRVYNAEGSYLGQVLSRGGSWWPAGGLRLAGVST